MVKKIISAILMICCFLLCSACKPNESFDLSSNEVDNHLKENASENVFELEIPSSYLEYSGTGAEDLCDSLRMLGDEYIVDVDVDSNGVKLRATQKQISNIIRNNNDIIDRYITSFERENHNYRIEGSKDYSSIYFYCDEKIDELNLLTTLVAISTMYGMNNILYNKNTEWDVYIEIINCNTNNIVVRGSILTDEICINDEVWENSYVD